MSGITAAESGYTYAGAVDLDVLTCPSCGIVYAIPARLREQAQEQNRTEHPGNYLSWHCPNGHRLSFPGKNEEQRLRDALAREREHSGRLAAQRDQAEASAKAQRGAATRARGERDRAKKRHAAGVCPCCHRSFKQLRAHMATKHPDYEPVEAA